ARGARAPRAGRRAADLPAFARRNPALRIDAQRALPLPLPAPDQQGLHARGVRRRPPRPLPLPQRPPRPRPRGVRGDGGPPDLLRPKLPGDETMRWLIVTADELGLSAKRNQGIVDAHCKGIVTSASMLAYGPAFREAVKIAKALPKLDIGLHLNLSEGEPLVLGHKTIVGPDGNFWGRQKARSLARDAKFDLREIEREVEAQIETLKSAGVRITHLNSV